MNKEVQNQTVIRRKIMFKYIALICAFVISFLSFGCGFSGHRTASASSLSNAKSLSIQADQVILPEEVSKNYTMDDEVGHYFTQKVFDRIPRNENRKAGQVVQVPRLQGIIQIQDYYDDGKMSLNVMNYCKNGGMSGIGGDMPKNLKVTLCGKPASSDMLDTINGSRMVVIGSFTIVGDGEQTHYIWQTLDLCKLE